MSHLKPNKAVKATHEYYDKNASIWTSRKTDSFYHENQFTKFASKLSAGSKVLDIGCAGGVHIPLFLGIGRNLKYTGIDVSKSFLKIASRRYPQLPFLLGNIGDATTLPKKKYDGFLAVAVLMHIPREDWPELFNNIEKLMKPKAIGYISLPTEHPSGERKESDPRHFTLLSKEEQKEFLKERKWKILHSGECDGFTVKNAWQWYIVQLP